MLICVTWAIKIQNSLPFNKFCQTLANSDITREALNCTAPSTHTTPWPHFIIDVGLVQRGYSIDLGVT